MPRLGVFIQGLWLWFSVRVSIPLQSLGMGSGLTKGRGWLQTLHVSSVTRCCGYTLHDKGTKGRLAPNVKPCKILALETSVKKVMFPLLRRSLLKISCFLSSRYSLLCVAIFPYIDISGRLFWVCTFCG